MYIARFLAHGKRLGRYRKGKSFDIYGQRFVKRFKRYDLTEQFVEEAGLGNPDTDEAVILSLRTDFGLIVESVGKIEPPIKEEVKKEPTGAGELLPGNDVAQ